MIYLHFLKDLLAAMLSSSWCLFISHPFIHLHLGIYTTSSPITMSITSKFTYHTVLENWLLMRFETICTIFKHCASHSNSLTYTIRLYRPFPNWILWHLEMTETKWIWDFQSSNIIYLSKYEFSRCCIYLINILIFSERSSLYKTITKVFNTLSSNDMKIFL